jgi:hypothetical protein
MKLHIGDVVWIRGTVRDIRENSDPSEVVVKMEGHHGGQTFDADNLYPRPAGEPMTWAELRDMVGEMAQREARVEAFIRGADDVENLVLKAHSGLNYYIDGPSEQRCIDAVKGALGDELGDLRAKGEAIAAQVRKPEVET